MPLFKYINIGLIKYAIKIFKAIKMLMLGIFRQEFIISAKDTVDKNNEAINIVLIVH